MMNPYLMQYQQYTQMSPLIQTAQSPLLQINQGNLQLSNYLQQLQSYQQMQQMQNNLITQSQINNINNMQKSPLLNNYLMQNKMAVMSPTVPIMPNQLYHQNMQLLKQEEAHPVR